MGSSGGAGGIRKQDALKQAQIKQGMAQIGAVFGGGKYGTGAATFYTPGANYFTAGGDPFAFSASDPEYLAWAKKNSPSGSRSGGIPNWTLPPAQLLEQNKAGYLNSLIQQGKLFTGSGTSEGFTPAFFDARTKATEAALLPQLSTQFGQANRGLNFNLANRGLLHSSAAQFLTSSLARELGTQKQNVANEALGQTQQLRSNIENQRQNLVNQLMVSADPAATAGGALSAASQFNAPSPLPAVGDLFSNWANIYLAKQLNSAYSGQGSGGFNSLFRSPGAGAALPSSNFRIVS